MAKYRLEQVAPIQQGIPPKEKPCWLLNLDMVESNSGRILEYFYVNPDEISSSTIAFDTGNVLYSKLRPYLNKVVLPDRAGYATSEMLPLKPDENFITREYLTYFLRSQHFVSYISEKTSGAKMPRANSSDLRAVEIECPPIETQKEITIILDKLISVIDYRKQQLQSIDSLIKARFVEMFGDPVLNNLQWPTCQLKEIIDVRGRVGWKGYKKTDLRDKGPYVIGATHLSDSGKIDLSDPIYLSTEKFMESPEIIIKKQDLIIAQRGSVGKVALVTDDIGDATINPCVLILRPIKIEPLFALHVFLNRSMQGFLAENTTGNTIPMITQKMVNDISFILPDRRIIESFVSFVQQANKSRDIIQNALDKAQLLFDSLMQKYFE